jgi:hypothetical protein
MMMANNELERMWKEDVAKYLEVQLWHFCGGSDEKCEIIQSG